MLLGFKAACADQDRLDFQDTRRNTLSRGCPLMNNTFDMVESLFVS